MSNSKEKIKLFAYVRVSTKKQMMQETYKIQRDKIKRFIKLNSEKYILLERFEDLGISAFKKRPNFDRMMEKIDECNGIIINKLSRIGRSVKDLKSIVEQLTKRNKAFIVLENNINTSTKEGMLFFHILSAFLEYEVELIKERTKAGMEKARAEGIKFGRKRKELDISDNQIKKLYIEKELGTTSIAKIAGCSAQTIKNRLDEMGINLRQLPHQERLIKSQQR